MNKKGERVDVIWIAKDVTERVKTKRKLIENGFVIFTFICY